MVFLGEDLQLEHALGHHILQSLLAASAIFLLLLLVAFGLP
jgi:hypothetical protein